MQSRTSSMLLWVAVVAVAGFAFYRFVLQPKMERRAIEQALEKGCEDVVKRFEEEKDEIAQDLAKLLEKMDDIDEEEGELRSDIEEIRKELQATDEQK